MQITYRDSNGQLVTVGEPSKPRRGKHAADDDGKTKLYLGFRYCKAQCFRPECKACGYFWGPGHERDGQPAHFGVR